MANYPKITGNSGAAVLDRPAGLGSTNFFQTKLTDSVSGKEYIYGVVIIESSGDPGSTVSISDMHIKNADGVNMSTEHEGTGATFRSNTAIQDAYFTLSPLQKTGASSWTPSKPFMGVVKSNNTSYEQIKTANWAAVSGTAGLTTAIFNAVGAGPEVYIKVNKNASTNIIDAINDATTAISTAEFIIPIYNHAYIEANPIPAGKYAAVLIKCDVSQGIFDGEKENTLSISHDSVINGTDANQDYNITLKVNGENLFIFGSSFVGVNFSNELSVSSANLFRTIKHISTDIVTGYSWHAGDETNPLPYVNLNPIDNQLYINSSFTALIPPDFFEGTTFHIGIGGAAGVDDTDILTAWNANGYIFEEATLTIFDASAVTQAFSFRPNAGDSTFFTQADSKIKYNHDTAIKNTTSFTFKHNTILSSQIYENGTLDATPVVDSIGVEASLYPNFVAANEMTNQSLSIRGTQGEDVIDKTVTANFLVYPQLTYGSAAIGLYDKASNLHTNNDKPVSDIVHASHTYVKLDTLASKYCPIVDSGKVYKNAEGNTSDIISKHNVRINVLNNEDVIGKHALDANNTYYRGAGSVKVFTATDENTVLADTSSATETTNVPTTSQKFLDYTIETTESDYTSTNILDYTAFAGRNSTGVYKDMDLNGGFYTINEEFRAPITNWQPGRRHGQIWGTQRIPYYDNVYATGKTYKTKGAYYVPRPLLHITPYTQTNNIGTDFATRLEFVGAPGTNPVINNINLGLKKFNSSGDDVFRQESAAFTCSSSANQNRLTDFANDAGSNQNSQIVGAEVFGISKFFGPDRHFVASTGYTAVSGGKGFTVLVKEDGSAAVCRLTSTDNNITCTYGKPTHPVTVKRADFAFTNGLASAELRSRVFRPYGYDLTCSIRRDIGDVIPLDVFIPTGGLTGNGASAAGAHAGSTTVLNTKYTASGNGIAGTATVDILDLEPKELGITFGGSTEIKSARFIDDNEDIGRRDGTKVPVFYKNLGSTAIIDSQYRTTFSFDLFNLGLEDVLIKSVSLFDPLYLPEGHFTIKPTSASTPTFSIQNANFLDEFSNLNEFVAKDLNTNDASSTLNRAFKTSRTSKTLLEENSSDYQYSNTNLTVKFAVNQSNASGVFFKALEIKYFRDEGITQCKKESSGSLTQRNLSEKRVWTSRVLIKVEIEQASQIKVSDTDGTVVQEDGSFDFGTIIG